MRGDMTLKALTMYSDRPDGINKAVHCCEVVGGDHGSMEQHGFLPLKLNYCTGKMSETEAPHACYKPRLHLCGDVSC